MNLAVERFVTVGEKIADDNPEIKQDMYEACKEARAAGKSVIHVFYYSRLDSKLHQPSNIRFSFFDKFF